MKNVGHRHRYKHFQSRMAASDLLGAWIMINSSEKILKINADNSWRFEGGAKNSLELVKMNKGGQKVTLEVYMFC